MFLAFDLNGEIKYQKSIHNTSQTFEVWNATLQPLLSPEEGFMTIGYSFDEDNSGFLIRYDLSGDTIALYKYKSYYYPENVFIVPEAYHQLGNGQVMTLNEVSIPFASRRIFFMQSGRAAQIALLLNCFFH